jgi:hypothetical protein
LVPTGYAVTCGPSSPTDVAGGLAVVNPAGDTDVGQLGHVGPSDAELLAYYREPGDFGAAAVVSSRSGLLVWSGTVVWDGRGDHTFPTSWQSADDLGWGCTSTATPATTFGWDFRDNAALSGAEVDRVSAVAAASASFDALATQGSLTSVGVYRYPRTVGEFDSRQAEWLVIATAR